ncbi:ankyrin repeat domain-containing protein SOWAHC [Corythoichthys intestinalis]|uniref:ankyrin repeat domain-containing protein SOWAHC n=1 Tax=Corythoichthys intestinalis TaxID=161448 RepID=UPI0025A4D203|nr:ankyrin repeat domain-containing protein SOWAHC [Corythoichthys intestinalis]
MTSPRTVRAVFEFLKDRGGRVQQMELIDHLTATQAGSSDPLESEEVLRQVVDTLGVLEVESGVKYVRLNEDYSSARSMTRVESDCHEHASECNGDVHETPDNNKLVSSNVDNKQQTGATSPPSCNMDVAKQNSQTNTTPASVSAGEVKLRERRRRESAPLIGVPDLDHPAGSQSQQVRGSRRVSKGSQRAMLASCLSEDSTIEGLDNLDVNTPKGSRRNFIELMMNCSPQVRRSLINRGPRLRDSMRSDGDSASLLSSATDEDCASVTLDPMEHEWMLCASDGLWESLQPLLAVEAGLVAKRDFVTGFTCLHWAAKQGKVELLSQLLKFAKDNAVPVNVNVRSGAGYTPLHLAAMHGHTQVVRVLLSDWEADPEVRDYSGRRAFQYLPAPLPTDLLDQGAVTSPGGESDNKHANIGSSGARGWRFPKVLQGNLNPLRLLNSTGGASEEALRNGSTKGGILRKSSLSRLNARLHRGRHRAQIIHSASFRDTGEVGRGDDDSSTPQRTRPLSNLFG